MMNAVEADHKSESAENESIDNKPAVINIEDIQVAEEVTDKQNSEDEPY
jgi:hypothetical protein